MICLPMQILARGRSASDRSTTTVAAEAGDLDRAQEHFGKGIRYQEAQGNRCGAGQTRFNVALLLARAGRFPDAREYARAALRDFESYGDRAAANIEKTRRLLAQIEQDLAEPR